MSVLLYLVACYISVVSHSEAARILAVFPVPSISHQVVFHPLTQELARRGHEVTVITPDPAFPKGQTPANLTEIDIHDLSYSIWQETFRKLSRVGSNTYMITQLKVILESFAIVFDAQLKTVEVQKLIVDKNKHFDLLLLEACVRPALIYSHIYKNVPVILISSLGAAPGNFELMGAPDHPFLYPSFMRQRLYNLTMWEKIEELYSYYSVVKVYEKQVEFENKLLRTQFGPDTPSVEDLGENVDMLFLNVHKVFEGIRPAPPSVIYLGGLHQKPIKELPEDLKSYLDSSKNGVIYLSFGTNVDPALLPLERIQMLVRVLSKLPYDVLWKWNEDELPGRTENIRISKWLPQSDLLHHPKIKVFITQGGLQSTDESITAGVPLIGFPMLGDQWFNVQKYVYHKIGVQLDIETFTEEQFRKATVTVIEDDSYRRNVVKLRTVMYDQPQPPLERAVWWTEYVLRHGGARHLRSPAFNITWTQYLELELVLTLLIGLSIIITFCVLCIYLLHKNVSGKYSAKEKPKRT